MVWASYLKKLWAKKSQKEVPKYSETVTLRTTQREDLFNICRQLMLSLEPTLLGDAATPVLIGLNGTAGGGKSAFSDAAIITLLNKPEECSFYGWRGEQELWWRESKGRTIEVGFINARQIGGCPSVHSFLEKRKYGGVTFISNGAYSITRFRPEDEGVSIEITSATEGRHPENCDRILTVTTRDERLLKSENWRKAISSLLSQKNNEGVFKSEQTIHCEDYPDRLPQLPFTNRISKRELEERAAFDEQRHLAKLAGRHFGQ